MSKLDIYYDWEYNGDYYRVRPGSGDDIVKNIAGLPPVLFFSLIIIAGIIIYGLLKQ